MSDNNNASFEINELLNLYFNLKILDLDSKFLKSVLSIKDVSLK